jgi:hypothetical protein
MANRENDRQQQQQPEHWQLPRASSNLDASSFSPLPSSRYSGPGSGLRTPDPTEGFGVPQHPALRGRHPDMLSITFSPARALLEPPGTLPASLPDDLRSAANAVRNPANIRPGMLQPDGAVIIFREWVADMIDHSLAGPGHLVRAPTGLVVFARDSSIRQRADEMRFGAAFMRWMTTEDPNAARQAGSEAVRLPPSDADKWFRRGKYAPDYKPDLLR